MSFIRNIHESLFPSEREARVAREHAAQTRARLSDARVKRIEAKERVSEAMERLVEKELAVAESYQWVGQPYQAEWAGLSLDEAYRRGLPDLQLAFQYDATQVANNDSLRNEMLKVCRILYSSHPHAKAVIDTAKAFVVGPHAWQVEPLPKINERPESVRPVSEDDQDYVAGRIPPVSKVIDAKLPPPGEEDDPREEKLRIDFKRLRKIKPAWDRWQKRGHIHPKQDWVEFWDEAWMRSRRDGEVFIHLGHNKKNGALSPRFLEPEEIVHPTGGMSSNVKGTFDKDMCGIRVDEDDPQTVIGYWWRPIWKLGEQPELLPADDVIHIKIGADSGARRGLPALFCVRHMLRHFDTWIQQSLKHQKIQSMIAVLRQWDKATPDAVSNFQASNVFRSTNMSTPAGNNFNYNTQQLLPFVDAPRGMTMNPFVPAGNYGDSEILARRVLLAVASGENMSECMVTGDAANANYASSRIAQIPAFRGFEATQGRWSGRVELVYHRWLATEAILGRQDAVTEECQLDCHVTPNPLPPFEMENTFGMITNLYGSGLITKRTAQEKLGIDLQMEEEREGKEQAKAAAQIAPFQPTETDEEPDLADDEEEPEEVEPVIPESRPVLNRLYEYLTGAKRNGTH